MNRYLARQMGLDELILWGRETLAAGDLAQEDEIFLRELLDMAGTPGNEAFGLTLEECEHLMGHLGQELEVSAKPLAQ